MPVVPAFCDSCGAVFGSGISVEDSRNVTFSGTDAGPCPACGGTGHVPDGLYNFIGQTIELLSGPASTVADLKRLAALLERARKNRAEPEDIASAIARETPAFRKLSDLLPRNRNELYGFLGVVLAAIALAISVKTASKPTSIDVNQVINVITAPPAPHSAQAAPRVGRNQPCPCGSGKKFKHCHGARK